MFSGRSRNLHTIGNNFAKGDKVPRHSTVFQDGDSLFSYGYHYRLAKRLGNGVFVVNANRYSNTTARHKSGVIRGIMAYGNPVIVECSGCYIENLHSDMKGFLEYNVDKLRRCRLPELYIDDLKDQLDFYHKVCKRLDLTPIYPEYEEFIQNLVQTDMKIKKKLIKYHMEA